MFHTHGANRAWNSGGASYSHVGNGRHNRNDAIGFRGTDDISIAAGAVRAAGCVIHNHTFRLDPHNGVGTARSSPSAAAFHCRTVRADTDDRDDVIDGDNGSDPVGHHSHTDRWQRDRDHFGSAPARQLVDHRMQLYLGGPADQWRVLAALNSGNSGQPRTRHDSTRGHAACHHQH